MDLGASGKYEMATLELREGMSVPPARVRRLSREAVALNAAPGDPAREAKAGRRGGPAHSRRRDP